MIRKRKEKNGRKGKKIVKFIFRWIGNAVLILFAWSILSVVVYKYIPVYVTPLMLSRCISQVREGKEMSMEHRWIPLEDISPHLVQAVIASEDNLFMKHNGFDITQIKKAIEESRAGKRQRGASTISQQTAKNVFLLPSRSYLRKGLEAYFTLLIEWIWGKRRIMEVYLNSIEMGEGIYGAGRLSEIRFLKPAKELTAAEAALIAATLPNPIRYHSASPSPYVLRRQSAILKLMEKIGPVELK